MIHKTTILFLALALFALSHGENNDTARVPSKENQNTVTEGTSPTPAPATTPEIDTEPPTIVEATTNNTATGIHYGLGASLVLLAAL